MFPLMSSEVEQIVVAYETLKMSPEEIAIDRELEVVAVKAALMQGSSMYRKACGAEGEDENTLNFSNEQLQEVNKVIYDLAVGAEDEHLRFKAATYVRDDKKGRKDVVKQVQNQQFNILMFNEEMRKMRSGVAAVTQKFLGGSSGGKVVNV